MGNESRLRNLQTSFYLPPTLVSQKTPRCLPSLRTILRPTSISSATERAPLWLPFALASLAACHILELVRNQFSIPDRLESCGERFRAEGPPCDSYVITTV